MAVEPPALKEDLARAFLEGDPGVVRDVDEWIAVVLRSEFRALTADWEDLRQEARTRVFACLTAGRFNGHSSLRTYVHRIARNVGIDHSRKAYRRWEVPLLAAGQAATAGAAGHPLERVVARDLIAKLLRGATRGDRRLLELLFIERLSYTEAAALLRVPEGTLKARVFRCRLKVLKVWRHMTAADGGQP